MSKISSVRGKIASAFECSDCEARASTSRHLRPRRAHSLARNSPTGPAPTIRTSVSMAAFSMTPPRDPADSTTAGSECASILVRRDCIFMLNDCSQLSSRPRTLISNGPRILDPSHRLQSTGSLGSSADEPSPKPVAPAGILRLPAERAFGLGIRRAADSGHHRDAGVADREPADPGRQAKRRLRADGAGESRQPLGHLGRLVVDDVVDARCASLDRQLSRAGGIVHVDERPDAGAAADQRKLPLTDQLDDPALRRDATCPGRRGCRIATRSR